jgi:hypothetical protein
MKSNQPTHEKLPSLNDIISPTKEVEPNKETLKETQIIEQINNNNIPVINIDINPNSALTENQTSTSNVYESPKVVKKTIQITTNAQPVTETHVSRKIITTASRGPQTNNTQNSRYVKINTNNNAPNIPTYSAPRTGQTKIIAKTNTVNSTYAKPGTKSTVISNVITKTNTNAYNNRYANPNQNNTRVNNNNIIINNTNTNTNNNKNNQGYTKYQSQSHNNQPTRMQNSHSYSGNRIQPKRPEVPSSYYKPRAKSPEPGTIKRKTINRGKPIENIQITHIIYSARPLEFHITEDLNMENLEKEPIQITESDRNNLQKSGKVEVSCSCDKIDIVKPEINLDGKLTHYQHCQGIGMTDDTSDKINPKYYSSEIKTLEPLIFTTGEPIIEILEFRSSGKNNTDTKTITKTQIKPVTNYNNNRGASNYTQSRGYTNTNKSNNNNYNININLKSNTNTNNKGVGNTIKTTSTSSNYRVNTGGDGSGNIVKETTTKVNMGSRSQFINNQVKPVSTTSTEKIIINQNNFFKK